MGKEVKGASYEPPLLSYEDSRDILPPISSLSGGGVILPPLQFHYLTSNNTERTRPKSEEIAICNPVPQGQKGSLRSILCSPSPSPPTSISPHPKQEPTYKYRERKTAPVIKLTTTLHQLYTTIHYKNSLLYAQEEKPDLRYDNEHFEYKIKQGEELGDRYKVISALGKGTFGQVVKCLDKNTNSFVALKVIKSQSSYTQQAKQEIDILQHINHEDENDEYGIIRMLGHFVHHNHLCIVFELLACNLYEVIKQSKSLSLTLLRKFAYQLLNTLHFLQSRADIIHSDLKPENILLRESNMTGIKVIDFGSSCHGNEPIFSYIQSRFYRAPEVLLGVEYNHAIDMWSLGCILVELHTGVPLFPGTDSTDQMKRILEFTGIPSKTMLERSSKKHIFFVQVPNSDEHDLLPELVCFLYFGADIDSFHQQKQGFSKLNLIDVIIHRQRAGRFIAPANPWKDKAGHSRESYGRFVDLVARMLECDPEKRIKPIDALHHSFFTQEYNWCDVNSSTLVTGSTSSIRKRRANDLNLDIETRSPKKIRKRQTRV